jgi:integrase
LEAELGLDLRKLYSKLSIPNLGHDPTDRFTPTPPDLKATLEAFPDDPIIIFLVHFGGRISELSGVMKSDVHLEAPVPYVEIKENPMRSLKSPSSARDFPLVGEALKAMAILCSRSQSDTSLGLLPKYFKPRGAILFRLI